MIKYCRNCVYPETKPDLSLDENGICDACLFTEKKKNPLLIGVPSFGN